MKIVKVTIASLSLFIFASSQAQTKKPEDKYLAGKELFDTINKNKDFIIDFSEMKDYYKNLLNWEGKEIDPLLRFDAYDTNEDKIVSLAEIKNGLDWKAHSIRVKARKNKFAEKTRSNTNSESAFESKNDIISTIEKTEHVPDVELSLQQNLVITSDDHGVEEEMSLEDFKAKFMNKKATKVKVVEVPKFMIVSVGIKKEEAQQKLKTLDIDNNGYVTLNEMNVYYVGKKTPYNVLIKPQDWFLAYDTDKNKKIDVMELQKGVDWKSYNSKK